jgi:xanthine/uracil/vitamin C permease (AzgA family)
MTFLDHMTDTAKHWIDALSVGALLATLFDVIPGVTAVAVLVWTGLRMVESWQQIKLNHRQLNKRD